MMLTICALAFGWHKERTRLHKAISDYEIRQVMSTGNWERRREIAKQLSAEPRKNIDKLLYMLSDPDNVTREIVERALRGMDSSEILFDADSPNFTTLLDVYSKQAGSNRN